MDRKRILYIENKSSLSIKKIDFKNIEMKGMKMIKNIKTTINRWTIRNRQQKKDEIRLLWASQIKNKKRKRIWTQRKKIRLNIQRASKRIGQNQARKRKIHKTIIYLRKRKSSGSIKGQLGSKKSRRIKGEKIL